MARADKHVVEEPPIEKAWIGPQDRDMLVHAGRQEPRWSESTPRYRRSGDVQQHVAWENLHIGKLGGLLVVNVRESRCVELKVVDVQAAKERNPLCLVRLLAASWCRTVRTEGWTQKVMPSFKSQIRNMSRTFPFPASRSSQWPKSLMRNEPSKGL